MKINLLNSQRSVRCSLPILPITILTLGALALISPRAVADSFTTPAQLELNQDDSSPHLASDYYSIRETHIQELVEETSPFHKLNSDPLSEIAAATGAANVILDNIINLGKKVWSLVEANKAVVSFDSDRANALPKGVEGWESMQEWKTPISKSFRATYTNFYGMNVLDFTFRVIFTPGGNLGGRGHYLTHIAVLPAELMVRSGYTFNAQASIAGITNAGTTEDPIAAAEIQLNWSLDNYAKHFEQCQSFYVRGDGYFQDLTGQVEPAINPSGTNANLKGNSADNDSIDDIDIFSGIDAAESYSFLLSHHKMK